jgi:hypothetical protein
MQAPQWAVWWRRILLNVNDNYNMRTHLGGTGRWKYRVIPRRLLPGFAALDDHDKDHDI